MSRKLAQNQRIKPCWSMLGIHLSLKNICCIQECFQVEQNHDVTNSVLTTVPHSITIAFAFSWANAMQFTLLNYQAKVVPDRNSTILVNSGDINCTFATVGFKLLATTLRLLVHCRSAKLGVWSCAEFVLLFFMLLFFMTHPRSGT